jgi:hypothetical protein
MAPNDDMADADVRLSEHADRLRQVEERQNIHARRFDDFGLVIMGSNDLKVKGLMQRADETERVLADIVQWRRDMTIYARAGLAILGITGLGTWLPYIREFVRMIGN